MKSKVAVPTTEVLEQPQMGFLIIFDLSVSIRLYPCHPWLKKTTAKAAAAKSDLSCIVGRQQNNTMR